ncbi:zf-TFIIB domain-containing protein [bacterium]|nr:zf-TFIIB domain-containing protein [bacterium]
MADTFRELKCPACQKVMKKIFIPKEGINVDVCVDGCGGMFFDNRELKDFDEANENIDEILNAIKGKTFTPVDTNNKRVCPACGANMVKNFSSAKHQITIDECYSCGGKFLDANELVEFRSEYDTEEARSQDMLNQVQNTVGIEIEKLDAENAERRQHRSLLKRLFDSIVYDGSSNI